MRSLRIVTLIVAGVLVAFSVLWVVSVRNAALRTLQNERNASATSQLIPFERTELKAYGGNDAKIIQNTSEVRDVAQFRDALFAATSGGLIKLSTDGELLRHYTVLDGLPESDLTAVSVYHDTLFIGSRSKGLVTFDGERFSDFRWTDREAQTITSLAANGGDLLIGTFAGGLIRFDGTDFVEIKPQGERMARITHIAFEGPRLYVGTFDRGLWVYEDNTWSSVTSADGLASDRIVGIATAGDRVYIATDLGLSVRDSDGTRSVSNVPLFSSVAILNDRPLLSKDNGDLLTFEKSLETISDRGGLANARLITVGGQIFQTSDSGILEIANGHPKSFLKPEANSMSSNFVSALAIDHGSELWVGTFRSGIDVISDANGRTRHLETDAVREINFLGPDNNGMNVATTGGLVAIGSDLKIKRNLTKGDALPSNSVTHFSGNAIAAAKGLATPPQAFSDVTVVKPVRVRGDFESTFKKLSTVKNDFFIGNILSLIDSAPEIEKIERERSYQGNLMSEQLKITFGQQDP